MLDKILRVNSNLVILYYTSFWSVTKHRDGTTTREKIPGREPLRVTSDDGSAMAAALNLLTHASPYIADEDLEPTVVLGRAA